MNNYTNPKITLTVLFNDQRNKFNEINMYIIQHTRSSRLYFHNYRVDLVSPVKKRKKNISHEGPQTVTLLLHINNLIAGIWDFPFPTLNGLVGIHCSIPTCALT